MSVDLCAHGDIAAACLDCLTGRPPERPNSPADRAVVEGGPSWPARFPGHCSGCNTAIHEREEITRMTDGTYQHGRCAT